MGLGTSQKNKQVSSGTEKRNPWLPAIDELTKALAGSRKVYDQQRKAQFFPGKTYVPMSDYTRQGLGMLGRLVKDGDSIGDAGLGLAERTLKGDFLSPDSNPAFAQMQGLVRQGVEPGLNASFSRYGRTGSGAHQYALAKGLGDAQGQLAYGAYNDERGRQMQTMGMLPMLSQQETLPAQQLMQIGARREGYDQSKLNDKLARYNFKQNRGASALGSYADLVTRIAGLGGQGYTSGQNITTTSSKNNPANDILGTALSIAPMLFGLPPMPMSTDMTSPDSWNSSSFSF